jgi:hypothetical protein
MITADPEIRVSAAISQQRLCGRAVAARASGEQTAAQLRAVGGDQAAPDTVLADVPVPQRELQALAAHPAGGADSDSRGRLLTSPVRLGADREPLIRIKTLVSTNRFDTGS